MRGPLRHKLRLPLSMPLRGYYEFRSLLGSIISKIKAMFPLLASDPKVRNPDNIGRPHPQATRLDLTGTEHFESLGLDITSATNYSIAAWVYKPDNIFTGFNVIWSTNKTGGNRLRFASGSNRLFLVSVDTGVDVPLATWTHIKVSYLGDAAVEMFINGVSQWTGSASATRGVDLFFGAQSDGVSPNGWFKGCILSPFIEGDTNEQWNLNRLIGSTAPSVNGSSDLTAVGNPAEVKDNTVPPELDFEALRGFTEGTGSNGAAIGEIIPASVVDPTKDTAGNDLQWKGSAYAADLPLVDGNARAFTGTEYVTGVALPSDMQNFRVGSWYKVAATTNTNETFILGFGDSAVSNIWGGLSIRGGLATSPYHVECYFTGSYNLNLTSDNPLIVGGTYYIELEVINGSTANCYVDGELAGTAAMNGNPSGYTSLTIGGVERISYQRLISGDLYGVNAYSCSYNLAEGAGDVAVCSDGINHGTYVGNPANTLQSNSNFINNVEGNTLYEHATLDPIRIHYKDGLPMTNYTPEAGYDTVTEFPAIEGGLNSEACWSTNIADDDDQPPAVHQAPTVADKICIGDSETTNTQWRTHPNGSIDRVTILPAAPTPEQQADLNKYLDK